MAPKKANRPGGSIKALAAALSVSERRIQQLLEVGMPDDVGGALAWRAEKEGDDSSAEALRKERILLVRVQREKVEHELRISKGEAIDIAEVEDAFSAIGAAVKGAISRLEADLPPMLEGMEPAKMQLIVRDKCDEVLALLEDQAAKVWQRQA